MGFWDFVKSELIDIIEWLDPTNNTIAYRFERHDNEIKNNAKLIVRESQVAVFINEGKLADVFTPGTYTLNTQNLPLLATLKGWKYGFDSPFKAEVYFVNTKTFTDQKWGTPNPVMLRDAEFGPVRLRAFGTYTFKITDAGKFLQTIVGTDQQFTTEGISNQIRNIILTRFTDAIAESKIPVLDMASNYDEVSAFCETKMKQEFDEYGLDVNKFLISNISLPPEVEKALDARSSMGVIGNMQQYTQFKTAEAIEKAAENPNGGGASEGLGLGMGFGMAQQMMNNANQQQQTANTDGTAPPPVPGQEKFYMAVNGQQTGPYDMATLQQMAGNKQLTGETLVWKNGMANWQKASEVAELKSLFQTPPPIPPQP